ncbi:lipid IV(A) 3-deoxy-D-manno-octulosonic acid transferase [Vibrio rhodolitus]|uniref:lipid IV(A) 3-deoxy-D-manno-octulosonic acid transferase n=1 Tax=Vibrio rhodolitus TaxID=2231649 RepID=UPI000E0A32AB|nr:lipid IV(A) 3-deoxy-D-manno-octulosonic acid transferase [Vibrio rhodolitus]
MKVLIRFLYTALLVLVAPALLYGLFRTRTDKPSVGKRWKEHFGFASKLKSHSRPVWIHAVSVGETIAATPFIRQLKKRHPDLDILLTTTTPTGAKQAESLGALVEHRYMPIDFGFAIKKFIAQFNPSQLLIIETELWPNTLHHVNEAGIPITLVNARLSEKSCLGYQKIQPIFNIIKPALSMILCQYKEDAHRFEKLGIAKSRLHVTGSIKFDINIDPTLHQKAIELRNDLGGSRPIWIAASTHQGEDEIILAAHKKLLAKYSNALLIIVPRHPERFNSVFELSKSAGLNTHRRTEEQDHFKSQVYLADTMGEMLLLMQAADVCFMGGSFLGDKVGGHNMLEPAALGKPIISGPSYFNFSEIVQLLKNQNAIEIVNDADSLSLWVDNLFNDKSLYEVMANGAYKTICLNKGAIERTINLVFPR